MSCLGRRNLSLHIVRDGVFAVLPDKKAATTKQQTCPELSVRMFTKSSRQIFSTTAGMVLYEVISNVASYLNIHNWNGANTYAQAYISKHNVPTWTVFDFVIFASRKRLPDAFATITCCHFPCDAVCCRCRCFARKSEQRLRDRCWARKEWNP